MPKRPSGVCPVSAAAAGLHLARINLPKPLKRHWNRTKNCFRGEFDTALLLPDGRYLFILELYVAILLFIFTVKSIHTAAAGNVRISSAAAGSTSFPAYSNPLGVSYITYRIRTKTKKIALHINIFSDSGKNAFFS